MHLFDIGSLAAVHCPSSDLNFVKSKTLKSVFIQTNLGIVFRNENKNWPAQSLKNAIRYDCSSCELLQGSCTI